MGNANKKKRPLSRIANDFFKYLGEHLPQQCASDEFYFLPRSEIALNHLDRLDDLSPDSIQDHTRYVQGLQREIPSEMSADLESEIDRILLKQSMGGFLSDFEEARVFRSDPTLYVKIALFAIDQVISSLSKPKEYVRSKFFTLLVQIPAFLRLALKNLHSPSVLSIQVASEMAEDACWFFNNDIKHFIQEELRSDKEVLAVNERVVYSWKEFGQKLFEIASRDSFAVGEENLLRIISVCFGYPRSLGEILEIARSEYRRTQEAIHKLSNMIDKEYESDTAVSNKPEMESREAFLKLYKNEVERLRRFFKDQDVVTFPPGEELNILETQSYLRSLRATASYKAPLTGNAGSAGTFYITPGEADRELISSHCPYLSAHETYPGHHILDHIRINHVNPIRRQIESPLFYEGWASYAEQLLDELGYTRDPRQHVIQLKRQLWRSLRAILDIELQTGKTTTSQAVQYIETLGFSRERAQRQVRRFCLTPGYQLCYAIGAYEIINLRTKFASALGLRIFHDILLGGGQIPFHLVGKRLKIALPKESRHNTA